MDIKEKERPTCSQCHDTLSRYEVGLCGACRHPELKAKCTRCGTDFIFTFGGKPLCPVCAKKKPEPPVKTGRR
jgi:hypothetical protein